MIYSFGYVIGNITKLMKIDNISNSMWIALQKDLYTIMKNKALSDIKNLFLSLEECSDKPDSFDIYRTRKYIKDKKNKLDDWRNLLYKVGPSYINMIESGLILNNGTIKYHIYIIDFNTESFIYRYNMKIIDEIKLIDIINFPKFETNYINKYSQIIDLEEQNETLKDIFEDLLQIDKKIELKSNIIFSINKISKDITNLKNCINNSNS